MNCDAGNFIKRLKKQREDALDYIIEEYSGLVHAISFKILSNMSHEAVDECVNDVFLSVWQNAKQFKGEVDDFKKWIAMVTKYKAIDRYRQLEKQRAREQSDEVLHEHPGHEDVQMHLLKKEEKITLLLAISKLPDMDWDIFMMKYSLHLTNAEIAASLNLSVSAVENRLYRGRLEIRIYPISITIKRSAIESNGKGGRNHISHQVFAAIRNDDRSRLCVLCR